MDEGNGMDRRDVTRLRIDCDLLARARMRGTLANAIKEALSCYVLTAASADGDPLPAATPLLRVELEPPVRDVLLTLQSDEGRHRDTIVNDALRRWLDAGVVS